MPDRPYGEPGTSVAHYEAHYLRNPRKEQITMPKQKEEDKKLQPPQHQRRQPGLESKMTPKPQSEKQGYMGSGKLAGKVALITGGDSGIGRAVAIAYAKEGADVSIVYLNERKDAEEARCEVEQEGRRCLLIAG